MQSLSLSVLFLLFCLFQLCSSDPSQNGTQLMANPRSRLYNPLVCYVETEGTLYGDEYHEGQRHEPCGPDVKYCQKITAHFISAQGQLTKITMKGCDTVSMLPHYEGLECRGNGCTDRPEADEMYTVCCCNTETCNSSTSNLSIFLIITSIFLISYHFY